MKKIKLLTFVAFSLFITSCNGQEKDKSTATNQAISKIEVIDFHSTNRCKTCKAIESSTKYTLDTFFKKELEEEKITFQIINVDDEKNEQLAEKFEASGTALIINVISNGEERQINLTDFAFMKGNDRDEFSKEFKLKIENELKNL